MARPSVTERVFLGWHGGADGPLVDRAARWILERRRDEPGGDDLSRVLVALPGARAAQSLRLALARRAKPSWTPPAILTQGALTDELVLLDRPVASRFTRTMAWLSALQELPPERFADIAARRPEERDLRGWLAIAELVRSLHAELAEEGHAFADVLQRAGGALTDRDRARWIALADAQARWERSLAKLGLADPHRSRFAAIEAGHIDEVQSVILVGVADMNRLLRHLVDRLGSRATALVFAPEELADAFDERGCLVPDKWKDRELALPSERWHVVDGPDAQAERAVELVADWSSECSADDVVIGVADDEVAPHLERRLNEQGIRAVHAVGLPLSRTPTLCWLTDLARFLDARTFGACAALVRHPDVERWLARSERVAGIDCASAFDRCHREHLPSRAESTLPSDAGKIVAALEHALGDLLRADRTLSEWAEPLARVIADVYAGVDLDATGADGAALAESLEHIGRALGEFAAGSMAHARGRMHAAGAIECLLLALQAETSSAKAALPGELAIRMVGWLDLALDPAPAVVVTGFAEGRVPRAESGRGLLPEHLQQDLGLPARDARLARDLYAASVLCASRGEIAFVTARRNRAGDPLLPSRLAFHVADGDLVSRVRRYLAMDHTPLQERGGAAPKYELPRDPRAVSVTEMRVTSFRDYLESPYVFYLKHVLKLTSEDDRAREMDGGVFGDLAHDVLRAFAESSVSASESVHDIEAFLRTEVARQVRLRFGAQPLPAVALQREQLAHRLGMFAHWQAERAARGWRIAHAEWGPSRPVALDLGDGAPMTLRGRIDRIDVNVRTNAWAILDYKTGTSTKPPASVHRRRDRTWRDLQLPLYTLLAESLELEGERQLGYVCIGQAPSDVGERLVEGWSEADLADALDTAREVARSVRAGKFFEPVTRTPRDPIFAAIAGQGLLVSADGEGDTDE